MGEGLGPHVRGFPAGDVAAPRRGEPHALQRGRCDERQLGRALSRLLAFQARLRASAQWSAARSATSTDQACSASSSGRFELRSAEEGLRRPMERRTHLAARTHPPPAALLRARCGPPFTRRRRGAAHTRPVSGCGGVRRLPHSVDLFLIETHVQDSYTRQQHTDVALEHLARRLLRWGGSYPIVMLTPFFDWCHQASAAAAAAHPLGCHPDLELLAAQQHLLHAGCVSAMLTATSYTVLRRWAAAREMAHC